MDYSIITHIMTIRGYLSNSSIFYLCSCLCAVFLVWWYVPIVRNNDHDGILVSI